ILAEFFKRETEIDCMKLNVGKLKVLVMAAALAAAIAGCKKEGPRAASDSAAVASPDTTKPVATPGRPATPGEKGISEGKVDSAVGFLNVKASGALMAGETFADVNGSLRERPVNGATYTELQIESHREP